MSRNPLRQRLIQIVEPVVASSGFELVDLRFILEQTGWTLRVQIDRPLAGASDSGQILEDRVDLTACEQMSRELSAVLDVDDPIPQAYNLEVSSPGIERPLRTPAHFAYFTGREARIALAVPLAIDAAAPAGSAERRNFRGHLRGVDGEHVAIECDGQTFRLPIADVETAKLVADWDAVLHPNSAHHKPAKAKPSKPGKAGSKQKQKEP